MYKTKEASWAAYSGDWDSLINVLQHNIRTLVTDVGETGSYFMDKVIPLSPGCSASTLDS